MSPGSSSVASCLTDANRVILSVDDAYLELVQRPRAELLGRDCLSFTAAPDLGRNDALLLDLQQGGAPFAITKRYVRPDRSTVKVTNHVSAWRDGAGGMRLLATCLPVVVAPPDPSILRNRAFALEISRAFALCKQGFGAELFNAPAAEALLFLYLAEIEGRVVSEQDLLDALDQPAALGRRWLRLLIGRGDIEHEIGSTSGHVALRIGARALARLEAILEQSRLGPGAAIDDRA